MDNMRPNQDIDVTKILNIARKYGSILVVVALIVFLATGIYTVGPDEEGVVLRFGKYAKTAPAGINWHLPMPIEQVIKVPVKKRYIVEMGFRTTKESAAKRAAQYRDIVEESMMLTGDENILQIDSVVTYEISNVRNFLFNVSDVPSVVKSAAESAIRQVVGNSNLDNVLTEGKDEVQRLTREKLQEILDNYEAGVLITDFYLQDVEPPVEVAEAFKDVASAREDRDRFQKEAEGYRNDIIPNAKGRAAKLLNEAEAYAVKRVEEAKGEVVRFEKLLETYQLGKEVTKTRLYLETLENVLPDADKTIVDKDIKNGIFNILGKEGGIK